jgi:RsiW-degrading membrane proteinase PrsW (M82 family)
MESNLQIILFGLLGGIVPAILWLLFWLREDKKRPEPRGLLIFSFVGGMAIVPLVIPLERLVAPDLLNISFMTIVLWALIEEVFKYLASYFTALRTRATDEPIDPMIYLITTALGFAALENTLFLINAFSDGQIIQGLATGNMRFIGATLLHTVSSAIVGASIALTFYKSKWVKRTGLLIGLILAIALHAVFNFSIMNITNGGIFIVFGAVWVRIVFLILFFEKVKRIKKY